MMKKAINQGGETRQWVFMEMSLRKTVLEQVENLTGIFVGLYELDQVGCGECWD